MNFHIYIYPQHVKKSANLGAIYIKVYSIILYISIFVWTLIPFRQWNQKYFWYFVFLAMIDPLTRIWGHLFHSNNFIISIPFINALFSD